MKYNVFIDGAEGTTGLKIHQYFQKREDIQVLKIEEAKRKDMEARLALIRQADISFLCLPDAAAKEIAEALGKETIDTFNTGESRGREVSHSLNYQKLGKDLATVDELAVLDGGKCILQLRGVRPFLSVPSALITKR